MGGKIWATNQEEFWVFFQMISSVWDYRYLLTERVEIGRVNVFLEKKGLYLRSHSAG